jgi:hypothetical protein
MRACGFSVEILALSVLVANLAVGRLLREAPASAQAPYYNIGNF